MRGITFSRSTALLATTALLAGCGGSDGGDAGTDPAVFSDAFTQATGVRLVERDSGSLTTLRPAENGNYERFGVFSIYITDDEDRRSALVAGGTLKEYEDGIAVSSPTSDRDPGVARRLDQAVRAAIARNPALIPVSERLCSAVGIDPARGKEGTCRLPDKQLTVVNAATELQTKPLSAQIEGATTLTTLPPQNTYSEPRRASGRYVIVRTTITNKGTSPLSGLRTNLVIGPNTYSESSDVYTLRSGDRQPFPLQPGASTALLTVYDIPADAARRALGEGAIELPAESQSPGGYLTDRGAVGRIRLADSRPLELRGASASGSSSSSSSSSRPVPAVAAPASSSGSSSTRSTRIASAEGALKEFYSALRKGNVRYVCRRLTTGVQKRFGGATACRQGRLVASTAKSRAPRTNTGLRFTTVLTSNQTRAIILVRGRDGFSDAARLARQDGLWRIQGTRKLTGR